MYAKAIDSRVLEKECPPLNMAGFLSSSAQSSYSFLHLVMKTKSGGLLQFFSGRVESRLIEKKVTSHSKEFEGVK